MPAFQVLVIYKDYRNIELAYAERVLCRSQTHKPANAPRIRFGLGPLLKIERRVYSIVTEAKSDEEVAH